MSVAGEERSGKVARRAGLGLGACLFLGLLFIPGLPLDPMQRRVAAVTALTASLWLSVAIPVGATSLIPAALFPLLGVLDAREVAPIYLRDLVLLFLGAFIIALGLERWNVHRRLALAVIQAVGSSRRRLVLGFMAAAAFLSMWINNTATTLMMLPIVTAVLGRVEEDDVAAGRPSDGGRFGWCLLLGVAYSASVGGMATPVGTAPNQEFLGQFGTLFPDGPKLTFGEWFIAFAPLTIIFVPLAWLLLTRVVYPVSDVAGSGREAVAEERRRMGPMTVPQKRMALLFAATAALWVFRADLRIGALEIPGWSRLFMGAEASDPMWYAQHKNDISDATVATLLGILAFVIPSGWRGGEVAGAPEASAEGGDRRFLMDWRTASRLPWDVLLLLGGGFCLAHAFKVSGLDAVLGGALAPILEGQSSWLVVAAVCVLVAGLTEITSNTATTAVLLPVMASAASTAGLDPMVVMLPATLAASAAFMMPVATPPNAVVFATHRVPMTRMARAGIWMNLLMAAIITLVFQLWSKGLLGVSDSVPDWAR